MTIVCRVSLLGLPHAERELITRCLLAAEVGKRRYELAPLLNQADLLIADADHAPSVQLVVATERLPALSMNGQAQYQSDVTRFGGK